MNNLEPTKHDSNVVQESAELASEPTREFVEIEPDLLAQVAGGPDGSVIGIS
jgi:hypothetical protein